MILVLADDLTGALEAGAVLRASGITSLVVTGPRTSDGAQGLVIDTETRHETAENAWRRVRSLCAEIGPGRVRLVYKKTDSTLRGNIGAEFSALLSAWPERKLYYAPAYPGLGRTVRSGRLCVGGIAVHQTAFAQDPLDPVTDSDIASVIARQACLPLGSIEIFDGETDEDLRTAARVILASPAPVLAAGPAGLLGCLAESINVPRSPRPEWPRLSRCLVVNGSLHAVSKEQVALADAHGVFDSEWRIFRPPSALGGCGPDRAVQLGVMVRETLRPGESLVVFGGDTAFGILQAFELPDLYPIGEIFPGVPVSHFQSGDRERFLVSKAGGFGPPDLLLGLHKVLAE